MRDIPINLTDVLDEIPIGVCLVSKERRIVFINRALEALTGFLRGECEGLPCSQVLRFNNCFEHCPVNKTQECEGCVLEGDIITRGNEKIPVRVTFAPLKDGAGEVSAYVETLDDLRQVRNFDPAGINPFSFGRIIGRSPQMEKIFQILPVIAQSDMPVLITGQIGTGKILVAEALHRASSRAQNPFVAFRCGALPEFLVESELFGVEKGAFAGSANKPGKFRLAQNGTLYIAEIGDLAPSLQTKLLNALDEKTIYPLGSKKSFQADVRVIAASSRNLSQMAREGSFRSELYFRLNAASLHLPPLKERGEDLRLLMDHFLRVRASLLNKRVSGFSDACLKILLAYNYPGNALELRQIVEYAAGLCHTELIEPGDLPAYLTEDLTDLNAASPILTLQWPHDALSADEGLDWSAMERKMIMDALVRVNGRRSKAAQLLGWGRSTLWRKMKHYGIGSQKV
ncbi:MAG: sigma 54-interacting transcriptional regulator [Syntrophobacteraceae bacterium]|jgi:PAS domain S-box-containing protein